MEDLEYYQALYGCLDEAVKNAVKGFADIGRLNDMCIETSKRLRKAKEDV